MSQSACNCRLCRSLAQGDFSSEGAAGRASDSTGISGVSYIDPLLAGTTARWNNGSSFGTAVDITYSFMTSAPATGDAQERDSFQMFTDEQVTGARAALALYAEVANVTFVESTDSSSIDIRFANNNQEGVSAGYAYYPPNGQVWLASDDSNSFDMTVGGYGYSTMVHEIGHAMGLKHPGNYNAGGGGTEPPYLSSSEDNNQYTIMSYENAANGLNNATLGLYDIAAIQFLYGANTATRAGNTTYTFDTSAEMIAIWDGGGTDTFDLSTQTLGASVDLRAGGFSSIGAKSNGSLTENNVAIAYNVVIENVVGTAAADTIIGNSYANLLQGGAGNDRFHGQGGADTIVGGAGADWVDLGAGTVSLSSVETLIGSSGSDWVNLGSDGNSLIMAAVETLIGGSGADWVDLGARGGTMITAAVETLIGGSGADFIRLGDRGNTMAMAAVETLIGGTGADRVTLGSRGGTLVLTAIETLIGGSGADYLRLGDRGATMVLTGIETLVGGSGFDAIRLGDQGNTFITAAIETLTGGSGTDRVTLGDRGGTLSAGGVEALIGGGAADVVTMTNGGVQFRGRGGADQLTLVSGANVDAVVFGSTSDGGGAGAASGWDEIYNFTSGTDFIQITGDLRTLVDHDGDGVVDSTARGTGGASLTTDDLLGLTTTVSSLADADFASFRSALGAVSTDATARSALVIGSDGTNSALYLISDTGNGSISAGEVRMLARFNSTVVGVGDFSFS